MINLVNLDDANTIYFARELEHIKPKVYEVAIAPLSWNKFIPIDSTTPPGAETVTYTQYDSTGRAKVISNYAEDIPLVDVSGQQFTSAIKSIADGFTISLQDIRRSQMGGKLIQERKMQAAYKVMLQEFNQLAFFGDTQIGLNGWLTTPNINTAQVAGNDVNAKKWENKTPQNIIKDINDAVAFMVSSTNGAERPDTLLIPIKQYYQLSNTQYAAGTDTTILEFFKGNNPDIRVEICNELQGAFGGKDGFILYNNSISKFWQEVPIQFEMLPEQWNNLAYKVVCHARYGGVIVVYPESQLFRTGI
jgi:hypothetical protein